MQREAILGETIRSVLEYFGVYKSAMERELSMARQGENVFIHFHDLKNKPWIIAFFWDDANQLLSDEDYTRKVYDLILTIVRDFIQQGALLKEHPGSETNERNHLALEA